MCGSVELRICIGIAYDYCEMHLFINIEYAYFHSVYYKERVSL